MMNDEPFMLRHTMSPRASFNLAFLRWERFEVIGWKMTPLRCFHSSHQQRRDKFENLANGV